jgi:cell envelope-related function transcriptional attenuator common domain
MISSYLDIPIHFYATMDFDGLIELVDAVGGVTVDSDLAFTQSNYRTPSNPVEIIEGEQELDGEEALAYARMRKKDPRGDFGRQARQQEVIIGILDQLVSFNTVTNLTNILNSVEPYLSTNATGRQMISIASNYSNAITDVEQLTLDGLADSTYFPHYGMEVWTWEPYEESLIEVQNELKEHLGLETSVDEIQNENESEPDYNNEYEENYDYDSNLSETVNGY